MKNPSFLNKIINNLPQALFLGFVLLFLPRFIFNAEMIQVLLVVTGLYIIIVSIYRKNKKVKSSKKSDKS
jgi:predicted membrane protein